MTEVIMVSKERLTEMSLHEIRVPALEIESVTKTFKKDGGKDDRRRGLRRYLPRMKVTSRVVDSVSLVVERGEVFGILGPNGSGKSTLVRIISTLLLPDGGMVRVFGHDVVREPDAVRRMISRVSADAAFFRRLSAMENLMHAAMLYGVPGATARQRTRELLGRLDMPKDKMDAPMLELSRGMQQKVAVTRAFLTSPVLLLLDEPTTGLDPKSKREVQRFVREVRDTHDATVLLTTHDMEEAELLCDRIAILSEGRVVAFGTAAELKAGCDPPTLEGAFLAVAGKTIEEVEQEEEE